MKRLPTIAAIAVLVLAAGGIAFASIPSADGTIHGCYKTSNPNRGVLIVIDSTASCSTGFAALNWRGRPQEGTLRGMGYSQLNYDAPDPDNANWISFAKAVCPNQDGTSDHFPLQVQAVQVPSFGAEPPPGAVPLYGVYDHETATQIFYRFWGYGNLPVRITATCARMEPFL